MLFTAEHETLRRTVSQFVENELNPHVEEWEQHGLFPAREVFKKMGDLGWLGMTKPESCGGLGLDFSYALVLAEELGAVRCGAIPMAVGVQAHYATPALAKFGSDALRDEFLAPTIAGDRVACIAVSEPHAGSDVANIKTSAVRDGDDYVINGTKTWITTATQADWACVLVNTGDGPKHKNKSLIVVPMDAKGVSVSPKFDKLGMRSSDTAQIFYDDVRVPVRYLIGEEGAGFKYQMVQFQEERMFGAANSLKAMELVINETIEYTAQRKAFGFPLLNQQTIHHRLAELQTEVEALRSLIYRACEIYGNGGNVTKLASMAKVKSGRLSREVPDACLQFWGGMGFMSESIVAQMYRDLRLISIGGGADEVMLGIVAKEMGILPVG